MERLSKADQQRLHRALELYEGDRAKVAKAFGVSPAMVLRWIKDHTSLKSVWLDPDPPEYSESLTRVPLALPSPEEMRAAESLQEVDAQLARGQNLGHALRLLGADDDDIKLACSFEQFVTEGSSQIISMGMGGLARSFLKLARRADFLIDRLNNAQCASAILKDLSEIEGGGEGVPLPAGMLGLEAEEIVHNMLISTIDTMRKIQADNVKGFKVGLEMEKIMKDLQDRERKKKPAGFIQQQEEGAA